jgi:hypothetical protein
MAKTITIDDQIRELDRELKVREYKYPEWSAGPNPKIKPDVAAHRIACIKSTLTLLRAEKDRASGTQSTLFQ